MRKQKITLAMVAVMLTGCAHLDNQVTPFRQVADASGAHRLIVNFQKEPSGFDFHSLVWQTIKEERWIPKITITQDAFQSGNPTRRWISDVHSLDPVAGVAIVKVAEGDAPDNSPRIAFQYSWRKWDLNTNHELERLQECSDPFDAFRTTAEKGW